ncbi:MAG: hypothetical protein ACK4N5_16975 [Myxococcales bacterium]
MAQPPLRASSLAAALLFLLPSAALAQSFPTVRDVSSFRSAGMGDATRGFASSSEAILLNPAGIAANVRFNLDGQALFEPQNDFRVLSATATDSQLNAEETFALSAGFGYYHYTSGPTPETRRSGSIVALALALPIYSDAIFIGFTGKYLSLEGVVNSSAITTDAAVMYRPVNWFGISAIAYNIIDIRNPEARRSFALGTALGTDTEYHVDVDVKLEPNAAGTVSPTFHVGGEYLFAELIMPRVGFIEDRVRMARYVTGGASLLLAPFAIDAMYRYDLTGGTHGFGVALRLTQIP